MNKILLIIQREYFSRVKNKSFILMTFLVPLLMIGVWGLIIFLAKNSFENSKASTIHVVDVSGLVADKLESSNQVTYIQTDKPLSEEKAALLQESSDNQYLLVIPEDFENSKSVELLSSQKPSISLQDAVESDLEKVLRNHQLASSGIDVSTLNNMNSNVSLAAKEVTQDGEKDSSAGATMMIAIVLSIVIYLTLFIYGAQVMRGIIEEKQNRIVEVVISSVKPFQLMFGKIVGIGLVGLTQFLLWIVFSLVLSVVIGGLFMGSGSAETQQLGASMQDVSQYQTGMSGKILSAISTINFGSIAMYFILYFLGGYLLYSALFAAVGSAVDNETETQQFMFPITLPLLFAYMMSFAVLINDPHGTLAFWLSMIPLTSPVAMLVRIPFGVPDWQIALSLILLIVGFVFTTWVAARIYRVGILMYGKKASYKELLKWFSYKG